MKHIALFIACIAISVAAIAQTDSLEQRLKQYKTLFEKGLITQEEYDEVKAGALKINSSPAEEKKKVRAHGFSFLTEAGAGMAVSKVNTKLKGVDMGDTYNFSSPGWKAPLTSISFVPGFYKCNFFIGPGVNFNYQLKDDNGRVAYTETDIFFMMRARWDVLKVAPLIDFSAGYAMLKYSSQNSGSNGDFLKRRGLVIEPGLGIAFTKRKQVTVRVCYRFLYLKHKEDMTYTDDVGNVIGSGYMWDTMNYLALKIGFQLR